MHVRLTTTLVALVLVTAGCTKNAPTKADDAACSKETRSITLQAANLTFLAKVGAAALNGKKPVRVATVSGQPDLKLQLACKATSTEDTTIHASCRVRGKTADGAGKVSSNPVQVDLTAGTPLQWGAAAEVPVELNIKKDCASAPAEE